MHFKKNRHTALFSEKVSLIFRDFFRYFLKNLSINIVFYLTTSSVVSWLKSANTITSKTTKRVLTASMSAEIIVYSTLVNILTIVPEIRGSNFSIVFF